MECRALSQQLLYLDDRFVARSGMNGIKLRDMGMFEWMAVEERYVSW